MNIVVLAGGTGLIGAQLSKLLEQRGYAVRTLTRTPRREGQYSWDPQQGKVDTRAFEGARAVVNLAGSGIAERRWTAMRKADLLESRVKSTETLCRAMADMEKKPAVFVSASAVGFYGNTGEAWLTEEIQAQSANARSFLEECCYQWEHAADKATMLGIRTVKVRIGLVLSKEGGALKEMARTIPFGLAPYFGNGQAWYPWIHLDDICRVFIWAIENPNATGPYNGAAPLPVRNLELVIATVEAMRRKAITIPVPAFVLRLILGEMSALLLNSNRVSAEKLIREGFEFNYREIDRALGQIWK